MHRCVLDETDARGKLKETHLPFEGFLEALVRLSGLKALPTDAQVEEAGCASAAEYINQLRTEDEEAYQAIVAGASGAAWGEEPPGQPFVRCVAHVCSMICFRGSNKGSAKELTAAQAAKFVTRVFSTAAARRD